MQINSRFFDLFFVKIINRTQVVSKELDKLGAMLEQLEPNDRINAIAKLLPYILPKQSEIKAELLPKDKFVGFIVDDGDPDDR